MNRALPILSLCLALLALAFAVVPRDPVVVPAPPREEVRVEADPELRRRVDQLEDDNRALWDRVVLLERRGPALTDAGVASPALAAEVSQLKEEVRALMTGEVINSPTSRAALKEVIREAEADTLRERQVLRQQRQEQRAAEQKAKWKDFVTTAKLTWAQEQELTRRLEAEDTARRAMAEQLQNGPPSVELLRTLREQRAETDQAMGKLLDPTQQEQYQALRREDRGGGGGRPDRQQQR